MTARDLSGRVALVTGASRGIGASIAQLMAQRGADVVINYRSKEQRAGQVAHLVRSAGQRALLARADLTNKGEIAAMMKLIQDEFGTLDYLVLNASGGLEKDKPDEYAMQLNLTAQERMVDSALPLMARSGRIIFVTSHFAHFYGQKPVYKAYEPVAMSKHAGEQALRARIPALSAKGISLVVVSGDVIEGTITPKLLARSEPGILERRRKEAGNLPTVEEFAQAIVDAVPNSQLHSGATIYVGSTD